MVEGAREGDSQASAVEGIAQVEEGAVGIPAQPGAAGARAGLGIVHPPRGTVVIPRDLARSAAPDQPVPVPVFGPGMSGGGVAVAGPGRRQLAAEAGVGVLVEEVVGRHHVHHPPDGVAAVEEGGGALDNLDPVQVRRIRRFGVLPGLGGQGPGGEAVVQDQDPVAVESAQDGAGTAGTEAALVDARFPRDRVSQAEGPLLDQAQGRDRGDRLHGVEGGLLPPRRRDRDLVPHGGEGQREIDPRPLPRFDANLFRLPRQRVHMAHDVDFARGEVRKKIAPLRVRHRGPAQLDQGHGGRGNRPAVLLERDGALEGARLGRRALGEEEEQQDEDPERFCHLHNSLAAPGPRGSTPIFLDA